jgi:hypothetical protein
MRFYPKRHRHTCGIDLHARTMYVCTLDAHGEVVLYKIAKLLAGGTFPLAYTYPPEMR